MHYRVRYERSGSCSVVDPKAEINWLQRRNIRERDQREESKRPFLVQPLDYYDSSFTSPRKPPEECGYCGRTKISHHHSWELMFIREAQLFTRSFKAIFKLPSKRR